MTNPESILDFNYTMYLFSVGPRPEYMTNPDNI